MTPRNNFLVVLWDDGREGMGNVLIVSIFSGFVCIVGSDTTWLGLHYLESCFVLAFFIRITDK